MTYELRLIRDIAKQLKIAEIRLCWVWNRLYPDDLLFKEDDAYRALKKVKVSKCPNLEEVIDTLNNQLKRAGMLIFEYDEFDQGMKIVDRAVSRDYRKGGFKGLQHELKVKEFILDTIYHSLEVFRLDQSLENLLEEDAPNLEQDEKSSSLDCP